MSAGGAIFICCSLLCAYRLFISTTVSPLKQLLFNIFRSRRYKNIEAYTADSLKVRKNSEALINIGRQNHNTAPENHKKSACEQAAFPPAGNTESGYWKSKPGKEHTTMPKISMLLSDEKSSDTGKTVLSNSHKNSLNFEDALNNQTETLEKQMEEFRQLVQNIQQAALEHSKPLKCALGELIQQVSAIREYAAYQQDRVEKLQDGYDWNIIRTSCLRVIRCIDNLESRISRLAEKNTDTSDLKEVRDELLFALESSGVEQFKPGVNSDYRGQEKFAEAVKEKQQCDDPKQAGKIAQVIRPGYQYFINDENIKVVRTAQVKLFG
jgi:molecular chaperone GrpE (heat shock protein)